MKFASWLSSLTNLVSLELYDCWKCRSLPALDQLPSLKEITIKRLTDLEYIDIDIRSCAVGGGRGSAFFPSLETMMLYGCPNLKGWRPSSPSSSSSSSSSLLPRFRCLSQLWITSCPNLTSTPASPSLEKLRIDSGSFKSLEQMLKGTISLEHEPSSFSLPSILSSSLKELLINRIEHLPEEFLPVELLQTLTFLEDLLIDRCPTLTCLPHAKMLLLTSLKILAILYCENLDLSNDVDDSNSNSNNNDAILWQGRGLRSLTDLQIWGIPKLAHLPRTLLPHSSVLQRLVISDCRNLASLPEWMPNLTSLQHLVLSNCENLDLSNYDDDSDSNNNDAILRQGQGLRSLTFLHIWSIPKLVHLPRRLLLHSIVLQSLEIRDCPNLVSWPEWMPNLTSLQCLAVYNCSQLSERCKNNMSEDWPKIAHIPNIVVHGRYIQRDGCCQL